MNSQIRVQVTRKWYLPLQGCIIICMYCTCKFILQKHRWNKWNINWWIYYEKHETIRDKFWITELIYIKMLLFILKVKGSVQRKLRPMLLYIILKLFSRRWTAKYLNFCLLKGHYAIYIKPLQRSCPSPITSACQCNSPSANCVHGQY